MYIMKYSYFPTVSRSPCIKYKHVSLRLNKRVSVIANHADLMLVGDLHTSFEELYKASAICRVHRDVFLYC